jgi:hypothetical protein
MLNTTAQLHVLLSVGVTVLFEHRVFIRHAKEIQTAGDKSLQAVLLRGMCTMLLCRLSQEICDCFSDIY